MLDHTNNAEASEGVAERVAALALRAMGKRTVTKPIGRHDDLHAEGLSSLGLVNLMLAVEEEFGVKVPERDMTPTNFRTIARITELVRGLSPQSASPES
jgi:acyl carrier protein